MRASAVDGHFDPRVAASELLRTLPCGIAVTDRAGQILYLNGAMEKWLGLPPGDNPTDRRLTDFLTKPSSIYFETHIAPMLHLQGFVREIACYLQRPGGGAMPVLMNAHVRTDDAGQVLRVDYTFFDATERTSYEAELRAARRESEQLAMIVRRSSNAKMRLDADGVIQSWNRGAQRMLGVSEADAIGADAETLVGLQDREGWLRDAVRRCDTEEEYEFDGRLQSGKAVEVSLARLDDPLTPGEERAYSLVLHDVSRRKRLEEHLNLLVGELNHRVKNVLGVVNGIARQTLKGEAREEFTERLMALSRAQDLIMRADGRPVDLRHLTDVSVAQAAGPARSMIEGPAVLLPAESVPSVSMVLHELMTNAMKYGALSGPQGRIELRWRIETPGRVRLHWQETGGPLARKPERQGFGSRMVDAVVRGEFGGSVDFEFAETGLTCIMVLNLPEQAENLQDRGPGSVA